MTMLDRMRRHTSWLKWSLALVVLAFIAFYIPDFLTPTTGAAPSDVVARVGDQSVTAGAFRRAYQNQLQAYRAAYGGSASEDLLRQMGLDQQILRQLIDERAAVTEARRLGLSVSDAEVAQRIYAIPAFQQDGRFAGEAVYAQVLASQRPPLTKSEFEEGLRNSLLVDKLRAALTDWITVPEHEVEAEFRRRNEKVKAELVVFSPDAFRDQVELSDEALAAYFEEHKETYRLPEKRKIKYLLIDVEAMRSQVSVPPADVERYYRDNEAQYTTPEQVRASHILLEIGDQDEAAVRAEAEALLKKVRAGADFAALAKQHSDDDASAAQGGDLDYFGRGRMVPEFEEVAFGLEPGDISDLVKSPFGFHIIKVTDKKPETIRPLAEVRQQIADQLAYERAQAQAETLAASIRGELESAADFEPVASRRGLTVEETGLFAEDEPIAGLGPAPAVTGEAFDLEEGGIGGPARVARGLVFFTPTGSEPARLPTLDEVKDRVRQDAVEARARALAEERARELAPEFEKRFAAAARKAGLEVKTTELV
ncbi:MAG TPA: SurA N-terminal domain-containing protein, partial [Methylomirabilota bacterium]